MADKIFVIKQKDVFSVYEAAEYLNVSTKTVYMLISTGELEAFKIRSRYKITANSLSEYIDKKSISNSIIG